MFERDKDDAVNTISFFTGMTSTVIVSGVLLIGLYIFCKLRKKCNLCKCKKKKKESLSDLSEPEKEEKENDTKKKESKIEMEEYKSKKELEENSNEIDV